MMDSLHHFFWEDSGTRRITYTLSVLAGVVLATVRTIAFHKPGRQVSVELVVFIVAVSFGAALFLSVRDLMTSKAVSRVAYRLPIWIRYAGILACIILLSAPHVSISTVQAAIVNERLERASSSVEPDQATLIPANQLKARFQKLSSIVVRATEYKIPAKPDVVTNAQNNVQEALKLANARREDVRNSGVAAFVALVAYAQANEVLLGLNVRPILLPHGQTGNSLVSQVPLSNGAVWWQGSPEGNAIFAMPEPNSEPVFPISNSTVVFNGISFKAFGLGRAFIGTDNRSQVVVMNATIEGATQRLDSVVWLNVRFEGSIVLYDGGPLYLGDVTFKNCRFEFGPSPESQRVLDQISKHGDEPLSIVSGISEATLP